MTLNRLQQDLQYFHQMLLGIHPIFLQKKEMKDTIGNIYTDGLLFMDNSDNDMDLIIAANKMLSPLHDSHSILIPPVAKKSFPIRFNTVRNTFYVSSIQKKHQEHIGKTLSHIQTVPINDIIRLFNDLISYDNEISRNNLTAYLLNDYSYLHECGLSDHNRITYSFSDGSSVTLSLENSNTESCNISFIPHPVTHRQNLPFSFSMDKKHSICYIQFNECHDKRTDALWGNSTSKNHDTTAFFSTFLKNIFIETQKNDIETLVFDLRNNAGGDSTLCDQIMDFLHFIPLKKYNQYIRVSPMLQSTWEKQMFSKSYDSEILYPIDEVFDLADINPHHTETEKHFNGNIIFIQGEHTASSAVYLLTTIKDNEHDIITIGENTYQKPTNYGNGVPICLPHSKLSGTISSTYCERPDKDRIKEPTLPPDVYLPSSLNDFTQGIDNCWDWIMAFYGKNSKKNP